MRTGRRAVRHAKLMNAARRNSFRRPSQTGWRAIAWSNRLHVVAQAEKSAALAPAVKGDKGD